MSDQPIRFDRFMERALYGPGGFYASAGRAGRREGDFITSPEVGPLFGAVLARCIDARWEALGRPEPFRVFDVGCGPGTLLRTVAVAMPDRPWELIGVDRAGDGASVQALPEDLGGSVVVANELLDNLPFRILVNPNDRASAEGLLEVFVEPDDGPDGPLRETLRAVEDGPPPEVPARSRVPWLEQASAWVRSVLDRSPASVHLFDYGAPTTAELAEREGGWLRTYRDHRRGDDPLAEPGTLDITTDVAWDQLPTPGRLEPQADFLTRWGLEALVEEGRAYWREHAHAPDLTALRMRSRVTERDALVDPGGLGGWWVASWPIGGP